MKLKQQPPKIISSFGSAWYFFATLGRVAKYHTSLSIQSISHKFWVSWKEEEFLLRSSWIKWWARWAGLEWTISTVGAQVQTLEKLWHFNSTSLPSPFLHFAFSQIRGCKTNPELGQMRRRSWWGRVNQWRGLKKKSETLSCREQRK